MKDLTGKRFGSVTIVAPTDERERGSVVWIAKHDNGDEIKISARTLVHGPKLAPDSTPRPASQITPKPIQKRRIVSAGDIFGALTAVKPTLKRHNGSVVWVLSCECGKTVRKTLSSVQAGVRSGRNPSCGCKRRGLERNNHLDLFGERYGHLVVIGFVDRREGQPLYWKCRCDCGKETVVRAKDIRYGTTTSCGCQRNACGKSRVGTNKTTTMRPGMKFNHLTITKSAGTKEQGRYFHCRCDCGGHTVVRSALLTTGQTRSCGCGKFRRPQGERRAA